MKRSTKVTMVALTALCIVIASCSSSGGTSKAGTVSKASTTASAGGSSDCKGNTVTGTVKGKAFTSSSAVAASLEGGKGYTLYLADFALKTDDLSMAANPDVAADKTMVVVADTVFNAPDPSKVKMIAAGDDVTYSADFGVRTFTVTAQQGTTQSGNNQGAKGTLHVDAVGDTFCGTVDYSDAEKTIKGSFEAPVKAF